MEAKIKEPTLMDRLKERIKNNPLDDISILEVYFGCEWIKINYPVIQRVQMKRVVYPQTLIDSAIESRINNPTISHIEVLAVLKYNRYVKCFKIPITLESTGLSWYEAKECIKQSVLDHFKNTYKKLKVEIY